MIRCSNGTESRAVTSGSTSKMKAAAGRRGGGRATVAVYEQRDQESLWEVGVEGSSRSKRVSAAAASVKSNSNSKIRSIGGIDGGEVARRGEVGSRPALSLLLQIVST